MECVSLLAACIVVSSAVRGGPRGPAGSARKSLSRNGERPFLRRGLRRLNGDSARRPAYAGAPACLFGLDVRLGSLPPPREARQPAFPPSAATGFAWLGPRSPETGLPRFASGGAGPASAGLGTGLRLPKSWAISAPLGQPVAALGRAARHLRLGPDMALTATHPHRSERPAHRVAHAAGAATKALGYAAIRGAH